MKRKSHSIFWLLIVIVLSAVLLSKLEDWQESRPVKPEVILNTTATIILVAYDGEAIDREEGVAMVGYENEDFAVERSEIGCGDTLIPIRIPVVSTRLKSILNALAEYESLQGLHNPVNEKGVSVKHVSGRDGEKIIVELLGKPELGGMCDAERLKSQIEETVKLYQENAQIHLNGSSEEYECMRNVFGRCTNMQ
jgi:hypothetical protein